MKRGAWSLSFSLWIVVAIAALPGCDAGGPPPDPREPEAEPQILSFAATPSTIDEGEPATLSWETADAVEIRLFGGEKELFVGDAAEGTHEVRPTTTTVYTLVASGETGRRARAEVEVRVRLPEPPVVLRFDADPPTIYRGASSTLRWSVEHADSVALFAGRYDLHRTDSSEGALTVTPEATTTYHLIATGPGGEVNTTIELEVADPPIAPRVVDFEATPKIVTGSPDAPATIALSWQVETTDHVEIVASPGGPVDLSDLAPGARELSVEVGETTTFALVAHGEAGLTATATAEARVVPAPTLVVEAPARVARGEHFEFKWATEGATSLEVYRDGELLRRWPLPDGTLVESIQAPTTYLVRVANEAYDWVETTHSVEVGPAEILTFEATSEWVPEEAEIELRWETIGGSLLEIRDWTGATLVRTSNRDVIDSGSRRLEAPAGNELLVFELVVWNQEGSASETLVVRVGDGPVLRSFEAADATLGEAIALSWDVLPDAAGTAPTYTLVDGAGEQVAIPDGANEVQLMLTVGTHPFTLTATTPLGEVVAHAVAEVFPVPTITLTADPPMIEFGTDSHVLLEWETTGAARVELLFDRDGDRALIMGFEQDTGATSGTYPFPVHVLMQVLPGHFVAVAKSPTGHPVEATVEVGVLPVTLDFTATPPSVVGREPITLAWSSTGTPSVSLDRVFLGGTFEPFVDITDHPDTITFTDTDLACWLRPEEKFDDGCVLFTFPDGFAFPLGFGAMVRTVRIYVDGFVSFENGERFGVGLPYELTDTRPGLVDFVNFAPFWTDLDLAHPDGATMGTLSALLDSDAQGRFLVIQWSNLSIRGANPQEPVSLNFQVILREDGSFDYRYGTMLATGSLADRAQGAQASIGYRGYFGLVNQAFFDEVVPGGLQDFGLRFASYELPRTGSIEFVPLETTTFTLYSWLAGSSEQVTVTVTPAP